MKASEIKVGGKYLAKVSNRLVTVRVDAIRDYSDGYFPAGRAGNSAKRYDVTNLATGRKTTFRSAQKFRSLVKETNGPKVDRYQGLKDGTIKPESLTEECIAKGTEWF